MSSEAVSKTVLRGQEHLCLVSKSNTATPCHCHSDPRLQMSCLITNSRPHLCLHIVPSLLTAAGGIEGVALNDVHHRAPHLLLQLQREYEGQSWT